MQNLRNFNKRISALEAQSKMLSLVESDFTFIKMIFSMGDSDMKEFEALLKKDNLEAAENLLINKVKKYSGAIKKMKLTESEKRKIANQHSSYLATINKKLNLVLDSSIV